MHGTDAVAVMHTHLHAPVLLAAQASDELLSPLQLLRAQIHLVLQVDLLLFVRFQFFLWSNTR